MNKVQRLLVLGIVVVSAAGHAFGSGFAFYENGAKASGQGGAWIARADDSSANWYNPAALVYIPGGEVQAGLSYFEIGKDTKFTSTLTGTVDAVSNTATPAHFYYGQKICDRAAWGVGLNNPFGLMTEWDTPPLTLSSRRAELTTYLLNPNIAFRLGSHWSLALGADYLAANVHDFSHDVTFPAASVANLTGEGDAWGGNFAVQFKSSAFAMAASYRSPLDTTIQGHLTFTGALAALGSPAQADVNLPGQTMVGAAWIGSMVEVELAGYWTEWSRFKQLDVETGNPATSVSLVQDWNDTWSYRLGAAFKVGATHAHEIRVGVVFDQSPIPPEHLRPAIPDSDRKELSVGYGYLARHWGIDVYAMGIKFDDATAVTATGAPSTDGVFPGTYESSIYLAGVTAKYRF